MLSTPLSTNMWKKINNSCNNFPDEARAELSWDFTLQDKRAKVQKKTTIHHEVNNSLFICMSILSDRRQQKDPRALCQAVPQFHMFPRSHRNIYFPQNGKEARKPKEICLQKGRFPYLCVLLRFENTLGFMPLGGPPSGEHSCTRTSPTTNYLKIMQRSISYYWWMDWFPICN